MGGQRGPREGERNGNARSREEVHKTNAAEHLAEQRVGQRPIGVHEPKGPRRDTCHDLLKVESGRVDRNDALRCPPRVKSSNVPVMSSKRHKASPNFLQVGLLHGHPEEGACDGCPRPRLMAGLIELLESESNTPAGMPSTPGFHPRGQTAALGASQGLGNLLVQRKLKARLRENSKT